MVAELTDLPDRVQTARRRCRARFDAMIARAGGVPSSFSA
jgi:hypothetical protein